MVPIDYVSKDGSTRKVYITNVVDYDYEKASKFGNKVNLTEGFVKKRGISDIIKSLGEHDKLGGAQESDYILLSGSNLISSIAVLFMYHKFHKVNILFWDKRIERGGGYIEYTLKESDINEVLNGLGPITDTG